MSDWETSHIISKRKTPPAASSSPSEDDGSELCPSCNRWTQLVVNYKEGYVVCNSCAVIVDNVIVDCDDEQEFNTRVLDDKVQSGEMTRLEATDLCTVISSQNNAPRRRTRATAIERELNTAIQRKLNTDKRDLRATKLIKSFCTYHRVSPQVEARALVLWTIRREKERRHQSPRRNHMMQIAAVLLYHAALENDCAILLEELAETIIYCEKYPVPAELDDKEIIPWMASKLEWRYKIQLKDIGLPPVDPVQQARSWVHRIIGRVGAGPKQFFHALGRTLDNLYTFVAANSSSFNPRFVAASVTYLTLTKQMGLRYTLEVIKEASGVLVTNISRHNAIVTEKVPCLRDPLKELEQYKD